MQTEILELILKGRELCAHDVVKEFNCARQYASQQLSKTAKSYPKLIEVFYKQSVTGGQVVFLKYYGQKKVKP